MRKRLLQEKARLTGPALKSILILGLGCVSWAAVAAPPSEAFRVLPPASIITPYLQYQTEMAWQQDDERRKAWEGIRTEQDLLTATTRSGTSIFSKWWVVFRAKEHPLHPRIAGKVQMDGFRIEKLIFESLPGFYVSALVYVPEDGNKKHPAILVPSGHAANGKVHYQALCQRLSAAGIRRSLLGSGWAGRAQPVLGRKSWQEPLQLDLRRACGARATWRISPERTWRAGKSGMAFGRWIIC